MKIYSWNMLYRNKELDRAFQFVSKSDFDIFCLQEVPEVFLTKLKTLPYHLAYRIDVERILPKGVVRNYVVILSKHPINQQGEIPFDDYWQRLPLHTRLFVRLMPSRFFSKIKNRGGLFVDVTIGEKTIRVFNLHLILAHPTWRLEEFERAMLAHDPEKPTIICGDFNIVESIHVTPLNWILGGEISDALFYRRERTIAEKHFLLHNLINVLRGRITHPFSRSQLDHILISPVFVIKNTAVLSDNYGSDHHPIHIEIS